SNSISGTCSCRMQTVILAPKQASRSAASLKLSSMSILKFFAKKKTFDIEAFIAGSLLGMQHVMAGHQEGWRFGQEKSWKVDEKAGRLSFCFSDGVVVSAPFQVIGTYNTKHHSFTWGW